MCQGMSAQHVAASSTYLHANRMTPSTSINSTAVVFLEAVHNATPVLKVCSLNIMGFARHETTAGRSDAVISRFWIDTHGSCAAKRSGRLHLP